MNRLDTQLRRASFRAPLPSDLHHSIMQAVRNSTVPGQPTAARWFRPSLVAPALVVLATLGVWWTLSRPPAAPDLLTAAAATLEQSQAIPQEAQVAMPAPLSQEMEFIRRDLQNAVDFLVSSLP